MNYSFEATVSENGSLARRRGETAMMSELFWLRFSPLLLEPGIRQIPHRVEMLSLAVPFVETIEREDDREKMLNLDSLLRGREGYI